MLLQISSDILVRIHAHGESSYPEEGAGLLLGTVEGETKEIREIIPLENAREDAARRNRYLLTPQDYMNAEDEAERLGIEVLGVFHSHPDHPNRPSEFDRDWAVPWFSYLITSVYDGIAQGSRVWLLDEDRSGFTEETLEIISEGTEISQKNSPNY